MIGLDREELSQYLEENNFPKFRLLQIWNWLYHHGVHSFDQMVNIPLAMRKHLEESFVIERPQVVTAQVSSDGTQKWLIRFHDKQEAETVHIPEADRGTLCVSSQIGCTLSCKFCYTGTQTLVRNLSSAEIVGQMMLARDIFGEWPSPVGSRHVSNIVMMGMGEPLYNYENVKKVMWLHYNGQFVR
jgi:23S rRNA (adenine2503-C2)-methyltransferase